MIKIPDGNLKEKGFILVHSFKRFSSRYLGPIMVGDMVDFLVDRRLREEGCQHWTFSLAYLVNSRLVRVHDTKNTNKYKR